MHVAHIEKYDWLETCHIEMEMPSGFTKKSNRQLRQADYNRLQPHIHRMVKLSYIWPFLGLLIVHLATLNRLQPPRDPTDGLSEYRKWMDGLLYSLGTRTHLAFR